MKFERLAFMVVLLLMAGLALAQSNPTPAQTGGAPAQGAQPPQGAQPAQGTQPAAGAQPVQPAVPQAKTKDEYDAFMQIQGAPDAAAAENLAIAFETKYPASQLKAMAYNTVMRKYSEANNADKVLITARKAVTLDPDNVQALLLVSSSLANTTHDTDIDRDEKQAELKKDAAHAIELLNAGALTRMGATPEQNNAALALAYSALGTMDAHLHNWAAAEPSLRKATELSPQGDPVTYLNLALALDNQQKYPEALNAANKAAQLATGPEYAEVLKTAQGERARLKQLSGGAATTPNASAQPQKPAGANPMPGSNDPNAQNKPQARPNNK